MQQAYEKRQLSVGNLKVEPAEGAMKPASIVTKLGDRLRSAEQALKEENPQARSEALDRIYHANIGQLTTGLSPAALLIAYTDWLSHMAISPNKCAKLSQDAWEKTVRFWQGMATTASRQDGVCFDTEDHRFAKRFKDAHWHKWPYCAMVQAYLNAEDWWQEATNIRGMQESHKNLVSFMRFQWLNALSPENNPLLNPCLRAHIAETRGWNLLQGWHNMQDDMRRWLSGERPAGTEAFPVGERVATTVGKVVFRNDLMELIQYTPKTATAYPEPVVFIPAWIMKYYILDLSPENSMVDYLVRQGHTVFMVSWKNPTAEYRHYGMCDYLKKGVIAALDAVKTITGQAQTHAVGYCIGGTLLAIAAAYMGRRDDTRLKTVTLFAAQTDFEEAGELMTFIDENQLCYLEDIMFEQGYLRGEQMSATFHLLQPKELLWSKAMQEYLMGERRPLIDLMAWNHDTTRLPYKMHSEYLRDFYLNNKFTEGDYEVDGEPVTLEDIRAPLFVVATEKDHVAPWKSVYKIHLYAETAVTFVLANKGHNGGIISEPGHKGRSYRIGISEKGSRYTAPGKWEKTHKSHAGSWWPEWHQWLEANSSEKAAPPAMGNSQKGYPVLCDAPGTYVREG